MHDVFTCCLFSLFLFFKWKSSKSIKPFQAAIIYSYILDFSTWFCCWLHVTVYRVLMNDAGVRFSSTNQKSVLVCRVGGEQLWAPVLKWVWVRLVGAAWHEGRCLWLSRQGLIRDLSSLSPLAVASFELGSKFILTRKKGLFGFFPLPPHRSHGEYDECPWGCWRWWYMHSKELSGKQELPALLFAGYCVLQYCNFQALRCTLVPRTVLFAISGSVWISWQHYKWICCICSDSFSCNEWWRYVLGKGGAAFETEVYSGATINITCSCIRRWAHVSALAYESVHVVFQKPESLKITE